MLSREAAPEVLEWIDEVADRFESTWRNGAPDDPKPPRIEDFLQGATGERRLLLLQELVQIDVECRAERGQRPKLEDYAVAFPELIDPDGCFPDHLVCFAREVQSGRHPPAAVAMPAPEAKLPRVVGKYQLVEVLGQGSFGTVYRARDVELARVVAVKVPRTSAFTSAEQRQRFVNEARSTARLTHPAIVPVYDIAHDGELPYIVRDYIDGRTLHQLMSEQRLGFREAAELVAQVADALAYAHERDVIHRDVNPRNILLDAAGRPHVTDFGLARRDESTLTLEGEILGTPAYMAPEQAAGAHGQADGRSDLYSLGVVLYELLTGELPFRGNVRMLLYQVLHDEPRPPRRLDDRVPRDLETICLKAMAKAPARRYATAADLAADLRRYLDGKPIQARPVRAAERLWCWCRRNPLLAASLACIALSLLAGTGVASYFAAVADARDREARLEQQRSAVFEANAKEMGHLRGIADEQRAEANKQRALVRRYLHFSRINMAHHAWQEGHVGRMDELLSVESPRDAKQADERGFEWHYLWRLRHGNQLTLRGHAYMVRCVAFSPDGERLASVSGLMRPDPGAIKFWNVRTGQLQSTLDLGWREDPMSVAFSPDGTRVAGGLGVGIVRLWDAKTNRELLSVSGPSTHVRRVSFSPDGRRIAGAFLDGTVQIWDAETGLKLFTVRGRAGDNRGLAFSPDGRRLAAPGEDRTIRLWDAGTGRELAVLRGHAGDVHGVAFCSDGRRLASASQDLTVRVWDADTSQQVAVLQGHTRDVHAAAFSPDGKLLASGSADRTIKVWDAATGKLLFTLKGHTAEVDDLAFSPDGKQLASGSSDKTVKIWDVAPQQEALVLEWPKQIVQSVTFSPDGKRLAGGSEDGTIKMWDALGGVELCAIKAHSRQVRWVAFSPDGRRLASAADDHTIKVWGAATGARHLTLEGHIDEVRGVAFSPDGKCLASSSKDGTVRLWNAETGEELLTLLARVSKTRGDLVRCVAFSPDGQRLACACDDCTATVWRVRDGQELLKLKHDDWVTSVTFSPDGRTLACAARNWLIKLWDAASGDVKLTLKGHTDYVRAVAFSPDGQRLASGSYDKTVKIWDPITGQETLTLKGHDRSVTSVVFSPDGRRLASASGDGTIRIWDGSTLVGAVARGVNQLHE
jgi:WD40 repeat protein/tRNA A-37 threonylcarbamoyl transferase component Bud32